MSEQKQTDAMSSSASSYRMPQVHFSMIDSRRYFADLPYPLPCDEQEVMNQHTFHQIMSMLHPELTTATITPGAHVLDVGSGSGEWLHDLHAQHPTTQCIGVDVLPPVHTNQATLPVNVLTDQLPFPDQRFDLVHMRAMMTAIPVDRLPFVLAELVRVTRIGGRIELLEEAPLQMPTAAYRAFSTWTQAVYTKRNLLPGSGHLVDQALETQGGIAQIKRQKFTLPLMSPELSHTTDPKVMGTRYIFNNMRALKPILMATAIAQAAAIDAVINTAYQEWVAAPIPPQLTFFAVSGQRVA